MCWFSIIVGVAFLIYACVRQVSLSVWHLTTDGLSSVSSSAYLGSCNRILVWHFLFDPWHDSVNCNWYKHNLSSLRSFTAYCLKWLLAQNSNWILHLSCCEVDSVMGIPEKLDPGPKTLWRTRMLWEPRILGGTKTLGGTRTLGGPGTPQGLKILWWSRKDPGIYKLGNVSLILISFH